MNMKLTNGLLGLGAMLIASQVSAATISVSPAVNNAAAGEVISLTVSGDFTQEGGTFGGGVLLSWNTAQLELTTELALTHAAVKASAIDNGWSIFNDGDIVVTSTSIEINVSDFFGSLPTFDIFSLDLVAVLPPSSGPITIIESGFSAATGGWDGSTVDFIGASVTTSAVPVPAAVWLFGSGLIGLIGVARRKA